MDLGCDVLVIRGFCAAVAMEPRCVGDIGQAVQAQK